MINQNLSVSSIQKKKKILSVSQKENKRIKICLVDLLIVENLCSFSGQSFEENCRYIKIMPMLDFDQVSCNEFIKVLQPFFIWENVNTQLFSQSSTRSCFKLMNFFKKIIYKSIIILQKFPRTLKKKKIVKKGCVYRHSFI